MNASPLPVDLIEVNASWTAFFHLLVPRRTVLCSAVCRYCTPCPMNYKSTVEVMDTANCVCERHL